MILYCRSMRTRSLFCLWSFLFSFTDGGESSLRGKEWLHPSVCRHFFSYTSEWKDKQGVLLIIIDCYWLLIGFIGSEPWLWRSIKLTNCLTLCSHFFSSIFVFSFLSNLKNQINHRRYQLIKCLNGPAGVTRVTRPGQVCVCHLVWTIDSFPPALLLVV